MYDLKPERTDSWEFGLQTRFLKHFNLDFTFYTTKTFNQTFDPKISVSSGYSNMYIQTGDVSNTGIELSLGYNNQWGDFGWSTNYTLSANRNKINELVTNYVHPESGTIITVDKLDEGGLGAAHFLLKKGGTLGDIYSLADVQRDSNGKIYVDADGKIYKDTNVDDIKLGSVFPKSNMAWRNDFSWKGFNLGFMISARFGGIVYSATQANLDYYGVSAATADARDLGYVAINNGENFVNPETWYTTIGGSDGVPQYYTYSATNVRLQEASISYTFKKRQLFGFGELTLSFIGRNLLMFYCKAPFDPETTATTGNYYQGIDKFMTPSTRNLGFNIKLKF
jgi:outer membrane receptor protein involved in Fe transport